MSFKHPYPLSDVRSIIMLRTSVSNVYFHFVFKLNLVLITRRLGVYVVVDSISTFYFKLNICASKLATSAIRKTLAPIERNLKFGSPLLFFIFTYNLKHITCCILEVITKFKITPFTFLHNNSF